VHLHRAELKALRAQVNPHFLFNALNTIAALIPRNPGPAASAVEQLAEVFRYTLNRADREWTQVSEELEAVRAYLEIERARFGERLRFRIEASPEAARARIPAMMVQTLVENAVKHGIAGLSALGTVDIRATTDQNRVRVEVRDSGPGFREGAAEGYGLRNIRERLAGYFGESAYLLLGRDADSGMTLAAVEMPASAKVAKAAAR
jgi:LytS/YehU family sensor histidine kinase